MSVRALFFVETPHRLAGAQRSLLAALTPIDRHGIDAEALFPGPGIVEEAYRAAGVRTRVLQAPPALLLFNRRLQAMDAGTQVGIVVGQLVPYAWRLARLLGRDGYDVVHFNTPRGILIGGLAARLARTPTVLHLRGAPQGFGRGLWLAAQTLADRIVLVARALEPQVARPFRRRVTVVYNGVPAQPPRDRAAARRALAERVSLDPEAPLFVSLSSLTPFKGLHHLLTAAAALRERGMRAQYVLAGGGGDERYERFLLAQRARLGLDGIVHVIGFVPDPLALLAAADALVLPSVDRERLELDGRLVDVHGTEGLPRSILEAMSLGVPVIASRVQGVCEQVDPERTGLVVPPGDPRALAEALARVAADPAWRDAAGAAGREVARARFTVDAASAGLASVLRGVVHRMT
jgi:glycosyltransferase involved in cell wall biosynthesis